MQKPVQFIAFPSIQSRRLRSTDTLVKIEICFQVHFVTLSTHYIHQIKIIKTKRFSQCTEPKARLLGVPLSAKLCDLFGRLGCFLLFVRCAFYYGTIFIIFIGAHSSGFRRSAGVELEELQAHDAPPSPLSWGCKQNCIGYMDMHIQAGTHEYVHLLFYLACSHFAATICRHNKLPIIFSFHISVIDFASRLRLHASMKPKGVVRPALQVRRNSYPM